MIAALWSSMKFLSEAIATPPVTSSVRLASAARRARKPVVLRHLRRLAACHHQPCWRAQRSRANEMATMISKTMISGIQRVNSLTMTSMP